MRDAYQRQLKQLAQELAEMGSSCRQIIDLAAQALAGCSPELKARTDQVGREIDESEHTIETICMKLLLRQQPVAGDLRQISAAMKMITDLERIGDQAEDIVALLSRMDRHGLDGRLEQMAAAAQNMVYQAVQAYTDQDLALARQVIASDDAVDACFAAIKARMAACIAQDPTQAEQALDILMIAKYLERIADHCTNVAEWSAFAITGSHGAGTAE